MHPIRAVVAFFRVLFGGAGTPAAPAPPAALPEPEHIEVEVVKPPSPAELQRLRNEGALRLLGLLQQRGRLIDFLQEDLSSFDDAAVGAAVREIHKGCQGVLAEYLPVEPIVEGEEDGPFTVAAGFDPATLRVMGKVRGEPPFRGTLRHHGWRVDEVKLAYPTEDLDLHIVAAAEVEL